MAELAGRVLVTRLGANQSIRRVLWARSMWLTLPSWEPASMRVDSQAWAPAIRYATGRRIGVSRFVAKDASSVRSTPETVVVASLTHPIGEQREGPE